MKTAIIFYSKHHGNTALLIDAIKAKHDIWLIDVTQTPDADLSEYDVIGFASGIYYGKYNEKVVEYAKRLPRGRKTFLLYTYGAKRDSYTKGISDVIKERFCDLLGEYGCYGFDTFGPFKLVGGIAKNHPTQDEIQGAVQFFEDVVK